MWFEILPSFGIISAVLGLPTIGVYFLNKAVHGNAYKRDLRYRWERMLYQRDRRVTDDQPYSYKGLEAIPDL